MNKARHAICGFLTLASLTIAPAISWAGPLSCPDGVGLCLWDHVSGWRPVWKVRDVFVNSYWTTRDGYVVTLARGHQDPGRIYVLSPEYKMMFDRELENALPLVAVTTETPSGALLICQATPELSACDTYLDPSSSGSSLDEPSFPVGCLYPRFLSNGDLACAELSSLTRIFVRRATESTFEAAYDLPRSSRLVDIQPYSDGFLIATTDSLHLWKLDGTSTRIDAPPPSWMVVRDNVVFLATSSYDEAEQEWSFTVGRLQGDLSFETLWTSNDLVPRTLTELAPQSFVLDAWSHGKRGLFQLSVDRGTAVAEKVWGDRNQRLWR